MDGDAALLRFLAAVELIQADVWVQYDELGGIHGGHPAYVAALWNLEHGIPRYISDAAGDELSHARFLNAYLRSRRAEPVDLDPFRTLASSRARGARQWGRLTNLATLDIDTSWFGEAREPKLGPHSAPSETIVGQPSIPLHDGMAASRIEAVAKAARYHFAFLEHVVSCLYSAAAVGASTSDVLAIIVAIGAVENHHAARSNLIAPARRELIPGLPACSIIRPATDPPAGAVASIKRLTAGNLFAGQSARFFQTIMGLARDADAARRQRLSGAER